MIRRVASIALGAMALLVAAMASANSPFFFAFDTDPTGGGAVSEFDSNDHGGPASDLFRFDVTTTISSENLSFTSLTGQSGAGANGIDGHGIVFSSGVFNVANEEVVDITLVSGDSFIFNSIFTFMDSLPYTADIIGLLSGGQVFSQTIGPGSTTVNAGGIEVDTVRIRTDDVLMTFDSFSGELINDLPSPGVAALLLIGLVGLRKRLQGPTGS